MKRISIGITGVNPFDGNRGVGALSYSIISILDDIAAQEKNEHTYYFILNGSGLPEYTELDINGTKRRVYLLPLISIYRPNHFAKLLVYFKKLLVYRKLDYVLDAGYGDSYSDIYGVPNFLSHNSIKRFFSFLDKKQMLLPQTVGPFFDTKVHKAAIKAMSNMQVLLCRDKMSYDLVHKDVPDVLSAEIIDMAFYMPYTKDDLILKKGSINVGIGISKMLWNKNLDEVMSYKDNYRELMSRVIEKFLSMDNVYLHLIPHVVCENVSLGNDYELCYDLWKHYHNERIILSPFFIDPIKAKNYISTMDFFTGARMHACIGAFSSGVPVFPIAYSRKFNGLFMETLGYNHVGDLTTMSNDEVIKNLMDTFDNRTAIKEEIAILLNTVVKEKYEVMKMHISKFLKS